jgi:hypothetical protein
MRCLIWILLLVSPLAFSFSSGSKAATVKRIYWHPMRAGERLDYCNEDKSCCGKVIADSYCHALGYHHANRFRFEPNLGLTHFLDGKNQCKGWKCSGFSWIECIGRRKYVRPPLHDYTDKLFPKPRWNFYPLSWCYDGHKGCGKKAAYAFCRYQGYEVVKSYRKAPHYATKQIGGGYLCFGSDCQGFDYIICKR